MRYRQGHTYGDETHRLANEYPHLKRSQSNITPIVKVDNSDPYQTRDFPDGMLPGYTGNEQTNLFSTNDSKRCLPRTLGYIPQRKFQLGNRYRVETDACLTGTKTTYEQGRNREKELRKIVASYPKTQSVNNPTVVKHFLDYHRAYNPMDNSQLSKISSMIIFNCLSICR